MVQWLRISNCKGVPGKKGANAIWLPTKEKRKSLLAKYSRNPDALYVEDFDEPDDEVINFVKQT